MDELIALSNTTLTRLPDSVRPPRYDRRGLRPGIVHIGLGNFHRAHQAWYLHRLFDAGLCHDWAIIGTGVRPNDAVQRSKLLAQDCLTTLIELDPSGKSAEICGSIIDFLPVEDDNAALIAQMADPATRIVSLTVTEGAYFVEASTGGFDARHPDILYDASDPDHPRTAFGAMIAALRLRRDRDIGPFTCQSCDNLLGNGNVLRQTIVSLAALSDPALADWIDRTCSFPNSMVDCIVPATGPTEIALAHGFGIDDAVPVTHENFRQWVLEDKFCAGRPALDMVGVTLTDDVHPFETMKIRILNGGHQIIANPGDILGLETIAETMAHGGIRALLHKVVADEIAPHVNPVPGLTPVEYLDLIAHRFSNPEIADTNRRVAFDGSSRHPWFIVPSIRDGLDAGRSVHGLALVSAIWARYCQGIREDGTVIAANDPHWQTLHAKAREAQETPMAWLEMHQIYGDLADKPDFADAFVGWMQRISADGIEAAIHAYVTG